MASHQAYEELKASMKRKKSHPGGDDSQLATPANAAQTRVLTPKPDATPPNPFAEDAPPATAAAATPAPTPAEPVRPVTVTPAAAVQPSPLPSSTAADPAPAAAASPKTYLIRTKSVAAGKAKSTEELAAERKKNDDGLVLTDPIQLDFVTAMMDHFKVSRRSDLGLHTHVRLRIGLDSDMPG